MLPSEVVSRLFAERDVLGLTMMVGAGEKRTAFWRIDTVEGPNDLADHSLGSASAQSTSGTGWNEIVDSQGRYHLESEYEKVVYQIFYGISPGQAWVYLRYPSNRDLNSLLGTRAIGSRVGHIDGRKSPYRTPSSTTELFTMYGLHPAFLGYHPYAEPSSITVRLYFYVTRYDVTFLGVDPSGDPSKDIGRKIAPEADRQLARVRGMGGRLLVDAPQWVLTAMKG